MRKSQVIFIFACLLWVFAIGLGLYVMMKHEVSPGEPAKPPVKWPKDSKIKLSSDKDTLVMFIHPQCPCSRASLEQLTPLTNLNNLSIQILSLNPKVKPENWEKNHQTFTSMNLKNARITEDDDGAEANRFHSFTSGQALLYDSKGNLIFSGGVTGARGKTGNNPGLSQLWTALKERSGAPPVKDSLVFGCSLVNDAPAK